MSRTILTSITELHTGLRHLIRLFTEARKYKDLEITTNEKTLTLPFPSLEGFTKWVLAHEHPMMESLHMTGHNIDGTKTIWVSFLLGEFPFSTKGVGVKPVRECLKEIHEAANQDKLAYQLSQDVGGGQVYLAREMEVTLVYGSSMTPDAEKHIRDFKQTHRRISVVTLSLSDHLRCYLLDHLCMPKKLRRLRREEIAACTPVPPLELNVLPENSVEVRLIGGVQNDVIESTIALKTGVELVQYWKIIQKK